MVQPDCADLRVGGPSSNTAKVLPSWGLALTERIRVASTHRKDSAPARLFTFASISNSVGTAHSHSKPQPTEREWLGEWRAYDNSIRISKATAGELSITGEAIWGSGSRTHTGELDHNAKPSADKMNFGDGTGDYDCQVAMQLVGPYLVVGDNLNCGGANVSFSGVYQRAKR